MLCQTREDSLFGVLGRSGEVEALDEPTNVVRICSHARSTIRLFAPRHMSLQSVMMPSTRRFSISSTTFNRFTVHGLTDRPSRWASSTIALVVNGTYPSIAGSIEPADDVAAGDKMWAPMW